MNTFAEIKRMKAELDAKIRVEGETALKAAFREFFDAHPEVRVIAWNQYTPSFNDGDACVFSVGDVYYSAEDLDPADVGNSYDLTEAYDSPVYGFFAGINDEDILKAVFGDGTLIVATRAGFHTSEYYE